MASEDIPQNRPIVTLAQARAANLKYYFTGKPCKRGHITNRLTSIRKCCICNNKQAIDWASRNPEKREESVIKWRNANPERHKAGNKKRHQKWIVHNRAKARIINRNWKKRNPEKVRADRSAYFSRRRAAGKLSRDNIIDIFKAQRGKCAYCKASLKDAYHADHIVALRNDGANLRSNIQLCCPTCNLKKCARDPLDFARSMNLLL
jgi:5-methylcytosine-specific restriction endonuclease McrA